MSSIGLIELSIIGLFVLIVAIVVVVIVLHRRKRD